jgi:hypothetical protein
MEYRGVKTVEKMAKLFAQSTTFKSIRIMLASLSETLEITDFNFDEISCFLVEMSDEAKLAILSLKLIHTETKLEVNNELCDISNNFYNNMVTVIRLFPNLVSLTIVNHVKFNDLHFSNLGFIVLENLETLELVQNESLTGDTFKRIANNCTLLKKMTFISDRYNCTSALVDDYNFEDDQYTGVSNKDLLVLLKCNTCLTHLSLTATFVSHEVFNLVMFVVPQIQSLQLGLTHKDINKSLFLHTVIELMTIPTLLHIIIKYNSKIVLQYQHQVLQILNINDNKSNDDYAERLADIFRVRKQQFKSVILIGFSCLSDELLRVVGQTNSQNLHTLKLIDSGKQLSIVGFQNLLSTTQVLKLIFVLNGSRALGRSGSFTIHGNVLIALLQRDDQFSKRELDDMVFNRIITSKVKYELNAYCDVDSDSDIEQSCMSEVCTVL